MNLRHGIEAGFVFAMSCFGAGLCSAATLAVPANFETIQACITAAVSGQDACVVAPGTYHEVIDFLGKAVTVRSSGGPAVTTIDATGLYGSVVTCTHREGRDTVLDGFTLTGGTGNFGQDDFGGGMWVQHAAPTIRNCVFSGNRAEAGGGIYNGDHAAPLLQDCAFIQNTATNNGDGGAMFNDSGSSPHLVRCTFSKNTAGQGGAIFSMFAAITVSHCTFSANTAYRGGAIFNDSYTVPVAIVGCVFEANSADTGGAIFSVSWGESVLMSQCNFQENIASTRGGGAIFNAFGSPSIMDCMFVGNYGGTAPLGHGGGMYNYFSNPRVSGCLFQENMAGAVGGAMFNSEGSAPIVTDCTFVQNSARDGGGMNSSVLGDSILSRCVFNGNKAGQFGGAMFNDGSRPTIDNSLFVGNTADGPEGGAATFNQFAAPEFNFCTFSGHLAPQGSAVITSHGSSPVFHNCILWNDGAEELLSSIESRPGVFSSNIQSGVPAGALDGGLNLDVNPLFVRIPSPGADGFWDGVDDDYGDLRLQPASPCAESGDHNFVKPTETDLDGHRRRLCESMGCYEFGVGDLNCDGIVGLNEAAFHATCITDPNGGPHGFYCEFFDFDADGDVDLLDFARFQLIFSL